MKAGSGLENDSIDVQGYTVYNDTLPMGGNYGSAPEQLEFMNSSPLRICNLRLSLPALALGCAVLLAASGCNRQAPDLAETPLVVGPSLDTFELPLPEANSFDAVNTSLKAKIEQIGGFAFFRQPESDDLGNIPQDPLNPLTAEKVALGRLLFNETSLGRNNVRPEGFQTYVCATCHPSHSSYFSPLPQAIGEGGSGFGTAGEARVVAPQYDSLPDKPDVALVRAPTIVNIAFQQLAMRNGRLGGVAMNTGTNAVWNTADGSSNNSLGHHGPETQAFAGLEEHRMLNVETSDVATNPAYQAMFATAFPGNPFVTRYNAAMAIAAYERTVLANQAPFQRWLRGEKYALTEAQLRGALLFFGKAGCSTCHTGPALNSMTFWAVGMNDIDGSASPAQVDLTQFGGTVPLAVRKGRGGWTGNAFEEYAFKTPQLYNLKNAKFYGHGGSFSSIRDVVVYYNNGVKQNVNVPQSKITPLFHGLNLGSGEIDDLAEFIENGLYDPNLSRFSPASTPLGLCFPANDPQAQLDLGCSGATSSQEWTHGKPGKRVR